MLDETASVRSIVLDPPEWPGHLAGQHVDVRLTAEDGYQAQRSYSIASAPDDSGLALTVERLDDGEVSPYLVGELRVGDKLELRGPIGGFFVWRSDDRRPLFLVAGGSGVVPLMAMLRLGRKLGRADLLRLVVSVRTPDDLFYADELPGPQSHVIYTRVRPEGRLGAADVAPLLAPGLTAYVCGSARFAEAASHLLVDLGVPTEYIRVERFGPTG